jgi:Mg2+ and Co2+ transporter CorA
MFRMMKMFKDSNKIVRYLNESIKMKAGYERLIYFVICTILFTHVLGCFWYFLAKYNDFGPDTWVSRYEY